MSMMPSCDCQFVGVDATRHADNFHRLCARTSPSAAEDTPTAQRLGLLWERLGEEGLARTVEAWLRPRSQRRIRLNRGDVRRGDMSSRWKVQGALPSNR